MEAGGRIGFGDIVRNHLSDILATFCLDIHMVCSVELSEAIALHHDIFIAKSTGLFLLLIESDTINAVNLVKNPAVCLVDIGVVIRDIHHLFSFISGSSVHFVSRSCNKMAQCLVGRGTSMAFVYR
ncbi:hypothetical protein PanWU01x14_331170 [Parasponia andersonii]|uniref:RNase H type-1 domain-containing protein n=1 Tax=Parasponia andersonii TaxID=3476 RepID=A0A2P5AHS4_PARAD|nr:hypothetical protein PanWU01x14_331170 [Parasponia andersonii]